MKPAAVVLAIGGGLAFVPYPTCVLRLALRVPCPACGMTRAALALAQGDAARASLLHPLAIPLTVLFAIAVALALTLEDDARWRAFARASTGAAAAALLLVWAARFAGLFGGPVAP